MKLWLLLPILDERIGPDSPWKYSGKRLASYMLIWAENELRARRIAEEEQQISGQFYSCTPWLQKHLTDCIECDINAMKIIANMAIANYCNSQWTYVESACHPGARNGALDQ